MLVECIFNVRNGRIRNSSTLWQSNFRPMSSVSNHKFVIYRSVKFLELTTIKRYGFDSCCWMLDGGKVPHEKIVLWFVWKDQKIKKKEAREGLNSNSLPKDQYLISNYCWTDNGGSSSISSNEKYVWKKVIEISLSTLNQSLDNRS